MKTFRQIGDEIVAAQKKHEMKTYQEWKKDAGVNPESKFSSICEGDYLDIQRETLRYAAQLCVKEFVGTNDGFVAKHACEKAILAAAMPNEKSSG